MLSPQRRVPWWHWALLSTATILVLVLSTFAGMVALVWQGVNLLDYVELRYPPFITAGSTAALILLLLAGQTLTPVIAMAFFRPARQAAFSGLVRPADPVGTYWRVIIGGAAALLLQILWTAFGPAPAENWRIVEHLVYSVTGGGNFWSIVWLVVTVGLAGPVAEEILYRGFLFGTLRRRWGFWIGAGVTALAFGLSHGLANAVPGTLLGFYFAWQVEKDRTLVGAIALHVLNNLGALLALAATVR